jgi:2-polyprenyl-6-methoxyphenol hydroxylase-like FAD-dependent oxidoreductase
MTRDDVLIIGAGPSGLVLALWLTKLGVRVRVLDKATGPGTTSRAMVVQARTLELYQQLDLAEAILALGHRGTAFNIWVEGEAKARVELGAVGAGLTPYPYLEIFPQDEHERLLVDRLTACGVTVERNTELLDYTDLGSHVSARYRNDKGNEDTCEALFIAGCDGARSTVREKMGADFPGGTYRQVFYVADVRGSGPAMNGEVHVDLDEADFLMVFGIEAGKRARLVGVVSDERADRAETLTFDDVSQKRIEQIKLQVDTVDWFSAYHVHHRVAEHFRKGRAFLVGDAGHIHSPAGGQGMNTGIGDAINLAWKLAAVVKNTAEDRLLDSYEAERLPFARKLVQTTDRGFSLVSSGGRFAEFVRTRIAPLVLPVVARIPAAPEFMFRTMSQTMISYRDGPLSSGKAGQVHGGDRLPWAPTAGRDNFDSLAAMCWQVHVYGRASDDLARWCASHDVPMHVFEWSPEHKEAGLDRDAIYLMRPDSYVALADASGTADTLVRYFATYGIKAGNPECDSEGVAP